MSVGLLSAFALAVSCSEADNGTVPPKTATICGDGVVQAGEVCEPSEMGCAPDCRSFCGDGVVGPGEACDPKDDPYCNMDCQGSCGDGVMRSTETCDDGNSTAGDGCSDYCVLDRGYTCTGEPSVCTFGPDVAPAVTVNDATAADIRTFCEWADAVLGGPGARPKCASSPTGFVILKSVSDCVSGYQTIPNCTATLREAAACWQPFTTPQADICALVQPVDTCIANACAGPAMTQCTGNGCPGAPCKTNADCTSGTHCTGDGRGWCDCDVPGASECGAPPCATNADCAVYGPGIDCMDGACKIGLLPAGTPCDQGTSCTSGTCNGGKCTGNHDVGLGGHCESSDWCLPGIANPVHCCASVCKDVVSPTDCTGQTGDACTFDYDCASYQCLNSRCV